MNFATAYRGTKCSVNFVANIFNVLLGNEGLWRESYRDVCDCRVMVGIGLPPDLFKSLRIMMN